MTESRTNGGRFFGCHVSAHGGILAAIARGGSLAVNTIQIHPSAPQRWNVSPHKHPPREQVLESRQIHGVQKIFLHGVYLINLASPDPEKVAKAQHSLLYDLELCAAIEGSGVIFHVGSLKDQPEVERGYESCVRALEWIVARAPAVPLLLEVSAGSGKVIGSRFMDLVTLVRHCGDPPTIGYALDTQHLWASGVDLTKETDSLLTVIDQEVGLHRVGAVHLNDSKTACGSCIDRHANLGEGLIGKETLQRFFLEPRVADIPFILETPAMKELDTAAHEVQVLRSWL